MSDKNVRSDLSDGVDLERREVLASLAKYSATLAGSSAVVLTASASVSMASISGDGGRDTGKKRFGDSIFKDKRGGDSGFKNPRGDVPRDRGKGGDNPSRKFD